jgi:hypothetical protein
MYNADKFFKLLNANEDQLNNQDVNSMFKLLSLVSIYENYIILSPEPPESHQIFQEFFKVSKSDREKLSSWLINIKALIESSMASIGSNNNSEILMVSITPSLFTRDSIR